jgi:hypothetical protein
MKKIISLFKRNYEGNRLVYNEIVPGAEWVAAGEGKATVKIDGTSCLYKDGKLYKRYDAKKGKIPPAGFVPAQDPDPITGHWPGWLEVGDGPEDKWHREALKSWFNKEDGATYELIGLKIQGNPYNLPIHLLVKHGDWVPDEDPPRDFEGLKEYFSRTEIEGIVWHRENGDMVKIKRRDFGFEWPIKEKGK